MNPENENALILNKYGRRMSRRGIAEITYKVGKMASLNRLLSPHVFRHTFATNMMDKGAELDEIAVQLGHSALASTQVYARLPMKIVYDSYNKCMG